MNIALIGYGKMGREIEQMLAARGHSVVLIVDETNSTDFTPQTLRDAAADIAIEFTTPEAAFGNIVTCLEAGVGVVCGTTGWLDRYADIVTLCRERDGAFFYAPNYSIGVNIFFKLNELLAQMMNRFAQYDVSMEEIHHIHKKDAPSGTAIKLAEGVAANVKRKNGWTMGEPAEDEIFIAAGRGGEVPGIHTVEWESDVDVITITHEAKSRAGLAAGVIMAAEFLHGRKGVYSMEDIMTHTCVLHLPE
ncbi:MAG: 4-hydroxy-tetrahydrodipicolinate reductase [Rikenellaceae bacterium]|nr:4-hydroxy-tetrahydrodipicolinate reductase [Rikenellaceae bacterium]MCL2692404.1 4-hydroxy-tetrahydrodipicolinate reductase [Rikenellaceae bacterium]